VEEETGLLKTDNWLNRRDLMQQSPFHPGQPIVLRQLWRGKVWEARPEIVVQDTPELRAFYKVTGTVWKDADPDIKPANRNHQVWSFKNVVWTFGGTLRLSVPGKAYSVIRMNNLDRSIYGWYINLEQPLRRTSIGFDYEDEILDIFISPDLSSWHWLDEDELTEAVDTGLMSSEKVAALYKDGEEALVLLQSGKSIFNEWGKWRPDPEWSIPTLPEDWDVI